MGNIYLDALFNNIARTAQIRFGIPIRGYNVRTDIAINRLIQIAINHGAEANFRNIKLAYYLR
jgi:hypothetical protein